MTTYYISPTGNDTTGNGLTPGTAWLTVSKFNSFGADGDTLIVTAGTYAGASFGTVTFTTNRTITGEDVATTIFDASGSAYIWTASNKAVTISNITFKSIQTSGNFVFRSDQGASALFDFTNCVFHDLRETSGYGILVRYLVEEPWRFLPVFFAIALPLQGHRRYCGLIVQEPIASRSQTAQFILILQTVRQQKSFAIQQVAL